MVNDETILADLATRSEAELLQIREDARGIIYGFSPSGSGLSQSWTWDLAAADTVLRLVTQVLAGRRSGDLGATDPLSLRGTLCHAVRFGGRMILAP